ncbi:PilZ domain-containing protein [Marichromatium bheemlicum]|uniref:PilZ domain-containing protein n=1 Tax=Marichromatium bheemlicum TaxID=365339 RepID=A0ABX1I793_9GAMM|nr:PilZ domain-containing protein [Marichromatium bheemlicum]NKN33429.1 PilZ domain-containing protein [Marichromatium bheemlicum]
MYADRENAERRRYERRDWSGPARLIPLSGERVELRQHIHHVNGRDIGEGGMCVSAGERFAIRSRLLLEMALEDALEPVQVIGAVVWVEAAPDAQHWVIGIAFCEPPAYPARLDRYNGTGVHATH